MKIYHDKVVVGSTEISDRWLYYYLGSHYYNHFYSWFVTTYPDHHDHIHNFFSPYIIKECGGDEEIILNRGEIQIVKELLSTILSDGHDLTRGLIASSKEYEYDDYITAWLTIKKTFAVAYYVCSVVQGNFRGCLPEGYFLSTRRSTTGYIRVRVNDIDMCIYDYMNHILSTNPDVRLYRQMYGSHLIDFSKLHQLLTDDLYRTSSDCVIL